MSVGLGARRLGGILRRGEQSSCTLDIVRSNRAGEQAVVADAVEAGWQDVQEKAADELAGAEGLGLEPVAAFDAVVLPLEADVPLCRA